MPSAERWPCNLGCISTSNLMTRNLHHLLAVVSQHQPWVNQQIRSELTADKTLSSDDQSRIRGVLGDQEGEYASRIIASLSRAESILAEPETDSRAAVACELLVGVVGAGLFTCFKTVGTGCLVAALGAGAALALC